MSDTAPAAPPSQEDKYVSALKRVSVLREKYPELHEAVLLVIYKHKGDCLTDFFGREYDPGASVSIHARFKDLDKVGRILANPTAFLHEAEKETRTKATSESGGGLRSEMSWILSMGRKVKNRVLAAAKKGAS